MKQPFSVLVVDDNNDILVAIRILLKQHFVQVSTLNDPRKISSMLQGQEFDLLLLDMNFTRDTQSGEEGLFYLKQALQLRPQIKVVMMTAYAALPLAVKAMQMGAKSFLAKPWKNTQLVETLQQAIGPQTQSSTATKSTSSWPLLGESPAMQQVFKTIEKIADTDANVLLLGESGTGKALVAEAIHQASKRSRAPFISVDLGSLNANLLESELFGHKKGAFTGAQADSLGRFFEAHRGTLLLDELGNLPPPQQAKLLTVLQDRAIMPVGSSQSKTIDIRLICATNDDIYQATIDGRFRHDLLYRINTIEIVLPPLRERKEDIPLLAKWYLEHYATYYKRDSLKLSAQNIEQLREYSWPGNVRQLAHAIERAVILADYNELDFSQLERAPSLESGSRLSTDRGTDAKPTEFYLDFVEEKTIRQTLEYYRGNISHTAKALGLTRGALYRRIAKYGI